MSRVVVAGGSGFLGSALLAALKLRDVHTVVLSRSGSPISNADEVVVWDVKSLGAWTDALVGADCVVNLCGSPIDRKWTDEEKRRIVSSRVEPTRALGHALSTLNPRPAQWVNISAIGYYGNLATGLASEDSPPGDDFLGQACASWEAAQRETVPERVRACRIRLGVVMGKQAGFLPVVASLARWFLGGAAGSGKQWVSWIHLEDAVALMLWAIENRLEGAWNAVAPHPLPNAELMAKVRKALGRPWCPPAPAFLIQSIAGWIGKEGAVILGGQRVSAEKCLSEGFEFRYPDAESALDNLLRENK